MQVLQQEEAKFNSADMNVAYRMGVDEYQRLCPYSEALEENWGKPPGTDPLPLILDTDADSNPQCPQTRIHAAGIAHVK